jgi:hypothetical protein
METDREIIVLAPWRIRQAQYAKPGSDDFMPDDGFTRATYQSQAHYA